MNSQPTPSSTGHSLIPAILRFDLQYPGVRAQRGDAPGLGNEAVPGVAGGIGDGVIVGEQPVREEALLEIEPDTLDGIELGAVGGELDQRDVVGHAQVAGDVPSGSIGEHGHVLVVGDRVGEPIEELLHRLGVGIRHDEREAVVAARLDRGEDIGEGEALVAQARRALTAPPPNVTGPPLLSNARLVLEEQADALFICMLKFSQKSRGSF